jgi:hypothetical protein
MEVDFFKKRLAFNKKPRISSLSVKRQIPWKAKKKKAKEPLSMARRKPRALGTKICCTMDGSAAVIVANDAIRASTGIENSCFHFTSMEVPHQKFAT